MAYSHRAEKFADGKLPFGLICSLPPLNYCAHLQAKWYAIFMITLITVSTLSFMFETDVAAYNALGAYFPIVEVCHHTCASTLPALSVVRVL